MGDDLETKRAEVEAFKVEVDDQVKAAKEKLDAVTRKLEDAEFENKSLGETLAEKSKDEAALEERCVDKDIELRPGGGGGGPGGGDRRLPIPAPPVFSALMGIVGVWLGHVGMRRIQA